MAYRNIAENFSRLSRAHERYSQTSVRRQTDGRQHIANVNVSSQTWMWVHIRYKRYCKKQSRTPATPGGRLKSATEK